MSTCNNVLTFCLTVVSLPSFSSYCQTLRLFSYSILQHACQFHQCYYAVSSSFSTLSIVSKTNFCVNNQNFRKTKATSIPCVHNRLTEYCMRETVRNCKSILQELHIILNSIFSGATGTNSVSSNNNQSLFFILHTQFSQRIIFFVKQ